MLKRRSQRERIALLINTWEPITAPRPRYGLGSIELSQCTKAAP